MDRSLDASALRMPKRLAWLVPFALVCSFPALQAQVFTWARGGMGDGWMHANTVTVDQGGNTLIGGEFMGITPMSFDGSDLTSRGPANGFIAMYEDDGTMKWAQAMDRDSGVVTVKAITAFRSGAVSRLYVTGEIASDGPNETVDFGSGHEFTGVKAGSSFVAGYTYTSLGATPQWVIVMEPVLQSTAPPFNTAMTSAIAVDSAGALRICGSVTGTADVHFVGNVSGPQIQLRGAGPERVFVIKLTPTTAGAGVTLLDTSTGSGSTHASAVAVGPGGDVVVIGYYRGTVSFVPNQPLPSAGDSNLFVARCEPSGRFAKAVRAGSAQTQFGAAEGRGVAVGADGNIYVAGTFSGRIAFGTEASPTVVPADTLQLQTESVADFFVAKYGPGLSPLPLWVKKGNAGISGDAVAAGMTLHNGDPYMAGTFSGIMQPGPAAVVCMGNHDVFVAHYRSNGDCAWAQRAGNQFSEANRFHYDQATGIASRAGVLSIVGEFGGTAGFPGTDGLVCNSYRNVFTARLDTAARFVHGTVSTRGGPGIAGRIVEIHNDNIGTLPDDYVMTDQNGMYVAYIPRNDGNTYRVMMAGAPVHWQVEPPDVSIPPSADNVESSFILLVKLGGIIEPQIVMRPLTTEYAEPGRDVRYLITYENTGTSDKGKAFIEFCRDESLDSITSVVSDPPIGVGVDHGTCRTWTLTSLSRLGRGVITVTCHVPDGVTVPKITSQVTIRPEVSPVVVARSPVDMDVVQPLDPNDKEAYPERNVGVTAVRRGDKMIYTIEFVNTGLADARSVTVTDALNPAFKAGSKENIVVVDAGPEMPGYTVSNGTVMFVMGDVRLAPRAVSAVASRGFITFTVPWRPAPGNAPAGTTIRNKASIAFAGSDMIISTDETTTRIEPEITAKDSCGFGVVRFNAAAMDLQCNGCPQDSLNLLWDFGDGITSQARNPVHRYSRSGTYVVTLFFGCSINDGTHLAPIRNARQPCSITKVITVRSAPRRQAIRRIGNILMAPRFDEDGARYQWLRNGRVIRRETRSTFRVTQPGEYTVRYQLCGRSFLSFRLPVTPASLRP